MRRPQTGRHPLAARLALALALTLVFALCALLAAPAGAADGGAPAAPEPPAIAHIHDREVFSVKVARSGHSAAERAKHATEVLEHAVEEAGSGDVRVDQGSDVAILYIGDAPVIQLGPEDAAAEGDASVAVHAAGVAAHVTDALHAERSRSALARTVFSFSLLVFSALIVFLALGKLGGLVARARQWVESRPATIPTVQIAGIDVLRPTALRGLALGAIDASRWVLRIGLVYVWLLFALSLFDATRAYSQRLTGYVLAPVSGFVGRLTESMPVLAIGVIAGVVLLLALRVVSLFFEGVTRGEPTLSWLPGELAAPTSLLLRIGLVVVATSAATPLLAGSDEGPLARASAIATGALALALTPVMASAAVGVTVLFGRRLRVGDFVELGDRAGLVRTVHLLGVTLQDPQGCSVHVAHLSALWRPTRVLGPLPSVVIEIRVSSHADVDLVTTLLARAAEQVGLQGRVAVADLDAATTVYAVTVLSTSATVRSDLLRAAARELRAANVALGPGARPAVPPPEAVPP